LIPCEQIRTAHPHIEVQVAADDSSIKLCYVPTRAATTTADSTTASDDTTTDTTSDATASTTADSISSGDIDSELAAVKSIIEDIISQNHTRQIYVGKVCFLLYIVLCMHI
jgi:hypothetical protein